MSYQPEIIKTADGSDSLFVAELNEHYHSIHGAIAESKHIFIGLGLLPMLEQSNRLRILEVGMGTGLNALLTALETQHTKANIHYTTIEAYPLPWEVVQKMNYAEQLGEDVTTLFENIHQAAWNQQHALSPAFTLEKLHQKLQAYEAEEAFDVVYFDAFAPEVQPELWSKTIFEKMYRSIKKKGTLVTYCVKGEVRRTLKAVGFEVHKFPGPPNGKREVLKAIKA